MDGYIDINIDRLVDGVRRDKAVEAAQRRKGIYIDIDICREREREIHR